ncbi:MAG: hypothetical protein AB1480_03940 [Nitrospirota bacterium]
MRNVSKFLQIAEYVLETLQIYFPCSLEIQEELIRLGYQIPIKTPIPIIYGNYKGYEEGKGSVGPKKQAIIHPSRYGKTLAQMGWQEFNNYYEVPKEQGAILRMELEKVEQDALLHLNFIFKEPKPNYHLERISYRAVEPSKWSNWAMFYIDLNDLPDMIKALSNFINLPNRLCDTSAYVKKEIQQGGQEVSFFFSLGKNYHAKGLGVPIIGYSLCLGCFDHVLPYFDFEGKQHGGSSIITAKLRLLSSGIQTTAKIGLSKMINKHHQFMFKLVAHPDYKKKIKKLDGKMIEGKARGELTYCDHKNKINEVVIDALLFLRVACLTYNFYFNKKSSCYISKSITQCFY